MRQRLRAVNSEVRPSQSRDGNSSAEYCRRWLLRPCCQWNERRSPKLSQFPYVSEERNSGQPPYRRATIIPLPVLPQSSPVKPQLDESIRSFGRRESFLRQSE